jgi:hypothetical protein
VDEGVEESRRILGERNEYPGFMPAAEVDSLVAVLVVVVVVVAVAVA